MTNGLAGGLISPIGAIYVLEAALVGPQGIALPLMTEFCENPFDNSEQKKQDCEASTRHFIVYRCG